MRPSAGHPPAFLPFLSTADGCSELRSLDLSGCCRIKGPGLAAFFGSAALVRPAAAEAVKRSALETHAIPAMLSWAYASSHLPNAGPPARAAAG